MAWIQLKINTTATHAEALSEVLQQQGALSVTFQDRYDTPVFEPLPGETRLWGDTDVIGLFDPQTNLSVLLATLAEQPLLGTGFAHQIEWLEDKDWEREWMSNFQPMRFGRRLWICPGWCEVPDKQAVNVLLDPGLAFGTGSHPTTNLCLQWLDSLDLAGKTVIDFGCGSGILAIAALKLGATQALGIDIDPQAIQASGDNARRNNVAQNLTLYLAAQQPAGLQGDVLVANILAGPLCELAVTISAMLPAGGLLALSGILSEQAERVCQAYQPYFYLEPLIEQDGWCRISGQRG